MILTSNIQLIGPSSLIGLVLT